MKKVDSMEIKQRQSNPRFIDKVPDERRARCLLRFTIRLAIPFWLKIDPQVPVVAQFHPPYHKQPATTEVSKIEKK